MLLWNYPCLICMFVFRCFLLNINWHNNNLNQMHFHIYLKGRIIFGDINSLCCYLLINREVLLYEDLESDMRVLVKQEHIFQNKKETGQISLEEAEENKE